MLDKKFIGRKYPPLEYKICRDKIREYAKSIGDMNPLYHDKEVAEASKYGAIIAPPLFAVVYTGELAYKVLLDKEIKVNIMMVVHGEMDFEFGEVLRDGDVVTSDCEIVDIYQKKNNEFIVAKVDSKNQNGEMVSRGLSTFVVRGG